MRKNQLIAFIVTIITIGVLIVAVEVIDMYEHVHESITIVMASVMSCVGSVAGLLHIKDKKNKGGKNA